MSLPFRPMIARGEYDAPFFFSQPMLPWDIRSAGIGGSAVSAAGIPESYAVRVDAVASLVLRVLESELADAIAQIEDIRNSSQPFTFAFDQDDPATDHVVYLQTPAWPDPVQPKRDDQFRGVFQLPIEIRTVDGSPFTTRWSDA